MVTLTVRKERVGPIRGRHPWVFSGALQAIPEGLKSGDPVRLVDEQANFLATGYFNSYSQMAVRLWGFEDEEAVDETFFRKRIHLALELRLAYVANESTDSYRLVHAENDWLPGLIVDRYGEYLSLQCHTSGIARWKEQVVAALVAELEPKGIFERSDVRDRQDAQRETMTGLLYGEMPDEITMLENGHRFIVDVKGGQKTGFFLDQRDKRQALTKYVEDKKVLNCFSYTGGFSVYALATGAERVVSVDASMPALELAEKNVGLNKLPLEKAEFIAADVKEYLADRQMGEFDVIILDPPAFVKDRRKVREGLQGYRKINELALRILPKNGILVTASCSAHVTLTDFRFMLSEAAARAGRSVQILETYTHGIDHPETVAFTEGEYLKCLFARVL